MGIITRSLTWQRIGWAGAVSAALSIWTATGAGEGPANDANDDVTMRTLFDFSALDNGPQWVAVNDGVMGGRSAGGGRIVDGVLHFTGTLSLENNGGFSSVRTIRWKADLSDAAAMVLRVQGDGRTYQLRISTDARFRGSPVSYGIEFGTRANEWTVVRIPLDQLKPSWRGRQLDGPPLDLSKVEEIGLLIGDQREGPFGLKVDWMNLE